MTITIHECVPAPYIARPGQTEYLEWISQNIMSSDVLAGVCPTACHAQGQDILLYSGLIKKVEDVQVGDLLMGPDSQPRIVIKTFCGFGELYDIVPQRGEKWTVTSNHMMSLLRYKDSRHHLERFQKVIENIPLDEYVKKSKNYKHCSYLWKPTEINWPNPCTDLPIDPYILGLWLGDGSSGNLDLTTMDDDIAEKWAMFGSENGLQCRISHKIDNKSKTYHLSGKRGSHTNAIRKKFISLGMFTEKHIPWIYLHGAKQDRLKLLAGLIDTCGWVNDRSISITQKRYGLACNIFKLAQSLGFATTIKSVHKTCQTGNGGTYFNVNFSGNTEQIPTILQSKKCKNSKRNLNHVPFTVQYNRNGNWYGFELSGDHLYLLGDFTVTHNTGKSLQNVTTSKWLIMKGSTVALMTPRKMLQDQYSGDFGWLPILKGMSSYMCEDCSVGAKQCSCRDHKLLVGKLCQDCVYMQARNAAQSAAMCLFNFHSYFFNKMFKDVAIIDEGHGAIDLLYSLFGRKLWKCEVGYADDIALTPEGIADVVDSIIDNLNIRLTMLLKNHMAEETIDKVQQEVESFIMLRDALNECGADFLIKKKTDLYYGEMKKFVKTEQEYIYVKTLNINNLAEKILWPKDKVKKIVLTSATIVKEDIQLLGLDNRKVAYYECASNIQKNNRLFIIDPVASMLYRNRAESLPKIAKKIAELAMVHRGQKGIVHCTYDVARKLGPLLGATGRYMYHDNQNKDEMLARFMANKGDKILISSGMSEGIDLKDDLARFQIITMLQFPSLQDDVMAWIAQNYPRRYKWMAIRNLVQQAGRIVRHPDDYGITYFIGSELTKDFYYATEDMWPQFFKEGMVWLK